MPESNLPAELAAKRQALRGILRRLGRVLVAYSGGVDSGLLLAEATAVLGAENALGVIARSRLMPDEEFRAAVRLAEERGFALRVMEYDEMAIGGFVANEEDRCYHCKTELLKRFSAIAREWGAKALCTGDNLDDEGDFRPGMRALEEAGTSSPLREARMTKADIRELARRLALPNWDKPSEACLASRVPYGERITAEKLRAIAEGERLLRAMGFRQRRLRCHGDIARIEIEPQDFEKLLDPATRRKIVDGLTALGFNYVAMDLAGYRTGSMNETREAKTEKA
ncbi:MAG: hypothetical protein BWZ10_02057 [candidate division BRC1 bacterium ADurb.BinA364]|nr:MAG: hypothetical protein BWZ10_02057 [candidate division BRC1 bacterium ADurb.BinA364]